MVQAKHSVKQHDRCRAWAPHRESGLFRLPPGALAVARTARATRLTGATRRVCDDWLSCPSLQAANRGFRQTFAASTAASPNQGRMRAQASTGG